MVAEQRLVKLQASMATCLEATAQPKRLRRSKLTFAC
jgi:hypothetical protein